MIEVCIPKEELNYLYNKIAHYQRMIERAREALWFYANPTLGNLGNRDGILNDDAGKVAFKALAALETAKMEGKL